MATPTAVRLMAIHKLKALQVRGDVEGQHAEADEILCEFLLALGEVEIVEAYRPIDKWFA